MRVRLILPVLLIGFLTLLMATHSLAGTAIGGSPPGVMDTAPPQIYLTSPMSGDVLPGGIDVTFEWQLHEPSLDGGLSAVRLEILAGDQTLFEYQFPPESLLDSMYVWSPSSQPPSDLRWLVAASDRYGNAAAETSGVFLITGIGDEEVPGPRPALVQVYPNPFNPRATIRYVLPSAQVVRLAIYDLAGRRIAILRAGKQELGHHEATWDASGRSSGSYLARLETAAGNSCMRLTLIK